MAHSNEDIVNRFFEAYKKHDIEGIKEVMDPNITWHFLGRHPLAGTKQGIEEVVSFFDMMAKIMERSKPTMQKLIIASNDDYFIECQHSKTNMDDGNNLDHYTCVLWAFKNGKIVEGRHFFADPQAVDAYFSVAVSMSMRKYV